MLPDGTVAQGRTIVLCTHNLAEASRLCDRVAVIRQRLLALDRPQELRNRLFGRRIVVRLQRLFEAIVAAAADGSGEVGINTEEKTIAVPLADPDVQTPALVRRLVAANAEILAIGEALRTLEDIYLQLVTEEPALLLLISLAIGAAIPLRTLPG